MPRTARAVAPGVVWPVLNRGSGRRDLFHKPAGFGAFLLRVPAEGLQFSPAVPLFSSTEGRARSTGVVRTHALLATAAVLSRRAMASPGCSLSSALWQQ